MSHTHRLHPHTVQKNSEDSFKAIRFTDDDNRVFEQPGTTIRKALVIGAYLSRRAFISVYLGRKNRSLLHDEKWTDARTVCNWMKPQTRFPRRFSGIEDARASSATTERIISRGCLSSTSASLFLSRFISFLALFILSRGNFSDSIVCRLDAEREETPATSGTRLSHGLSISNFRPPDKQV